MNLLANLRILLGLIIFCLLIAIRNFIAGDKIDPFPARNNKHYIYPNVQKQILLYRVVLGNSQ